MGDCMNYPETIEEFIKQYSFKDTEEIYTNGAELIPVFRVMQAIEHYIKEWRRMTTDEIKTKMKSWWGMSDVFNDGKGKYVWEKEKK